MTAAFRFLCDDILTADLPVPDAVFIFNAYPHLLDKTALAKKLFICFPQMELS